MSSKEIESKLHSAVTYLKLPSDGYLRLTTTVDMTWVKDEEEGIGKARWVGYPTNKGDWNITFPYQYTANPLKSITDFPVGTVIDLTKLFPTPTEVTKSGVTYEFSYWYLNPICGGDENTPVTSFTMPKWVDDDFSTHIEFIAKWKEKE